MTDQPALWLRAHRPVLEELHDVQDSLRRHALEVARAVRTARDGGQSTPAQGQDPALDEALDRLQADCERLETVCRVLTHCTPPPGVRVAESFRTAIAKLAGAAQSESLGGLVRSLEDGSADLDEVETRLTS